MKALPVSPTKRLAECIGVWLAEHMESSITGILNTSTQKEHTLVTNFFFHPDIVYTCPGIKDLVVIWENVKINKKIMLQTH